MTSIAAPERPPKRPTARRGPLQIPLKAAAATDWRWGLLGLCVLVTAGCGARIATATPSPSAASEEALAQPLPGASTHSSRGDHGRSRNRGGARGYSPIAKQTCCGQPSSVVRLNATAMVTAPESP